MAKKKKKTISVYKDGKSYIMVYTMPDGQRIAYETKFVGK